MRVLTVVGARPQFITGKKCVTILDFVCWPETMAGRGMFFDWELP